MFLGVTSHHNTRRVTSYAEAQAVLEACKKTATGKRRTEKPEGFALGLKSRGVTWVKGHSDGSIGFTLYATEVICWHPDNSVVVNNWGSVTTSGFASRFLPSGISLCCRRTNGGSTAIQYRSELGANDRYRYGRWSLCQGTLVRFVESPCGQLWLPDEETCDEIVYPRIDRSVSRDLGRKYSLPEFKTWLEVAPAHMATIEHEGYDYDACVAALLRRDFTTASKHLSLMNASKCWRGSHSIASLNFRCAGHDNYVSLRSIERLRLAMLIEDYGVEAIRVKTPLLNDHERYMKLARQMKTIGHYNGYGLD